MSKKRGTAWLSIERANGNKHLFQLAVIDKSTLLDDNEPICPECGQKIRAEFDTIQFGFWDTSFQTFFTCEPCGKAYRVDYIIAESELAGVTHREALK